MIFLLLTLMSIDPAYAEGDTAPSAAERTELYEEQGMGYAKSLYLSLDGNAEDESRSRKAETLNQSIRDRAINRLTEHLAREKKPRVRRGLLHRLSQLHEQQAEVISRRTDLRDKEKRMQAALRESNRALESLAREFPAFAPDATAFNLAENYAKLAEEAQAERYYRRVIDRFPSSPVAADSLLALGNLHFERQRFAAARNLYGRILVTGEQSLHPYAHYKIAWCYFNESDFHSAVARLEQAVYESRKLQQNSERKLGVEEEALGDLVLFFAEYGNPEEAKSQIEKLVSRERANELRFQLARRLFEHGKHALAKRVAQQLLAEGPEKEYIGRLHLTLISVAERTKDRNFGLQTAESLSGWLKQEPNGTASESRTETEEYMRLYSQRLHHEAETMKQAEVWDQARKSYEIYLRTFADQPEATEVRFRYAVLLLNRKDQLGAYRAVSESLARMEPNHPRLKEALRVRIQSVELASAKEREQIAEKDILAAYDAYAKNYPGEDLGVEAAYKAANLAKTLETPEQAAARFRGIVEAHPGHELAKASVGEALAVLVKAGKWEALGAESRQLSLQAEVRSSLLEKDAEIGKKIAEAGELSLVKLTESLEQAGQIEEAKARYEKILAESPSYNMSVYSLVRLATLAEQREGKNREALAHLARLRELHPGTKESRDALLEMARISEKVNEPRDAARLYLEFSAGGKAKLETQALTNAAVLLEKLGDREQAAQAFFRLAESTRGSKNAETAYESGCNNLLLVANRSSAQLKGILDCAQRLGSPRESGIAWQARGAWALDQMAEDLQAEEQWRRLAAVRVSAAESTGYVALAKLRVLQGKLDEFRTLRFTKSNERPEANIAKKTNALEGIERLAQEMMKLGSAKQVLAAKALVREAYLDFAEAMDTAALPSKLGATEQEELRKSFQAFAKDFRDRAATLGDGAGEGRTLASLAEPAPEDQLKLGSLSGEEKSWVENGAVPPERAAEIFAKKAYALYRDGKFGEARYFSEKWKEESAAASDERYGGKSLELFRSLLARELPESDPVSRDF